MNKSSVTFGFSTLKTKSDRLGNTALNQEQQKMADKFKALEPKRAKTGRSKEPSSKDREALVFSDNSNIQLLLWKKGKMLGKNVFRDVTLTRSGNELFQLSQEIHKKSYDAPTEFSFETKEEYKQKVANKADKKKLLSWEAKEIAGFDFRITFRRAASTESDPSPDMAYYFKNREDWVKTRNYLKFIKLLESEESKPEARPHLILQKLEKTFQNVIKNQFRSLLKKRADTVKVETQKTREETIQNSEMLKNFDQGVVNTLKNSWSKYAEDSEAYKKEQERLAQERKESTNKAVQSSPLLYNLNEELMKKLSTSWKGLVASKYSKDRRDIQVYFNNLELASDVIQPSLKVEIKFRKDYPDIPTINGKKITNKFQEYQLYCQFQYSRTSSVNCWRITPTQRVAESQSPMNLQTQQDSSPSPMRKSVLSVDDPFMLVFNDFRTEFIDCVEIKVILYDEISTIMGYYYASLKSLYTVAERGHSTCLCLKVNNETITKFPLIHLKILSYLPNRTKSMHREAVETTNKDYIEDMFYNYRFKIPAITPKHVKYLELLPDYWNIMEKKVKSKNKTKKDLQLLSLVESVRSNLFDSYYQNTARQIAHGTRSAYLWSELQDELMLIASQPETLEENQLFVDCDSLRNIISKNATPEVLPTERASKLDHAVSYLFKRDQWEKKSAWVGLYDKLKTFCRKGIPPQYRLSLWSELGKVVYFVELAENLMKRKRLLIDTDEDREGVNFSVKARRVYEVLLRQSEERNSYLYQSLEEDIEYLRNLEGKDVLINERYLRKICKAFIAWSKLMSESSTPAKLRYYVPYSREIVVLCYGLVVCQTCRFIDGNTVVEEDQILWLLTSLTGYILSRYYQVNEDAAAVESVNTKPAEGTENSSKSSSSLTNSALRCNSIKGIKSDLLLLKLMLKETEKDIFYKFEEFGVPLEFYFADHMLTLFVNLFNPGLTFRCWDVIFFEGSGADGANANKMIICIIYALLKDCKEQILQARTPDDLKFIIELYGRFETKYGNIIKKAYETLNTCLDVTLKPNASVLDRLSHFKQIMFTDISRGINKAMSQTERQLESFYQLVHQQNQTIYTMLHPNQSLNSDPENDLISYQALKKMISDWHSKFSNIQFKQGPKNKNIIISLKIHQILLNSHGNGKIALEISCGGKTIAPEQSLTPLSTNFGTKFEFPEAEGVPRDLLIEIYSQEEPTTSQRIGHRTVNLESLLQNTVNKTTLQMFSDNLATKKNIPDLSEIELSVFISTSDSEESQNNCSSSSPSQYLVVSELENPNYRNFRKLKLLNHQQPTITLKTEEASPFTPKFSSDKQLISPSSSPSYEIKQNFEISYQWFEKIVKGIAPAWGDKVDLESLYNLVSAADHGKKFYITNFFALLVLFGKLTLNQRVELLFNVFTGHSGFLPEKVSSDSVSSYLIKDLIANLYEAFMIYIPQNEIENLGDIIISGHTCFVTKVTLNGTHKIKPDFPRQTLNRLINYIHLHSGRKEVCLHSKEIVKILKTTYEKDMSINLLERANAGKQTNELKIYYTSNGLGNVYKLQITDNWEIVSEIQDQISEINPKSSESLSAFQNIISLTNQPKFVKKAEFVNIVKNLPMIDYLCSFDNLGMTEVLDTLKNPRFTVMIDREVLYSVQPSFSPNIKLEPMSARSARASPEKFPKAKTASKTKPLSYYLENWDQVVERARFLKFARKDEVGSQHRIEYDPQLVENQISFDKLNIYMPFADISKLLKKRIIKTASNLLDKSKENIKHLNMKIFNRNLWKLDFKIVLKIDTESFDVDLATKTPFHAMNEILDQHRHLLHKDELAVEIQVSLQADKYIHEKEPRPVQMALCTSPDGSREWLPCTVQFKYRYVDAIKLSTTPVRTDIDGHGIIYERFPKEIILKPANEVLFVNKVNQDNLEVREIEKEIVPGQ